jgi:hypothetical protein
MGGEVFKPNVNRGLLGSKEISIGNGLLENPCDLAELKKID